MSGSSQRFKALIGIAAEGRALTLAEAGDAFAIMMTGEASPAQIAALLMAMRMRGETVEEIMAGALALRERMVPVIAPENAIDVVGTGGDASGTHNISTAAAFVVAGCGVPVAKHGNKGVSSPSGSADVLTALGVDIACDTALVARSIAEAGIGFMMAPRHHGAMRHVAGPRGELGVRTIFNLLGPLANPASVRRQVTGVFSAAWVVPLAEVLGRLGSERAWVVHGSDGLDELTTTGPTLVAEWDGSSVRRFEITPEDAGLPRARLADLKGGAPADNAAAIRSMLAGDRSALRDAAILGAAAALVCAGVVGDLRAGAVRAATAIDDGAAAAALARLIAITNSAAAAA